MPAEKKEGCDVTSLVGLLIIGFVIYAVANQSGQNNNSSDTSSSPVVVVDSSASAVEEEPIETYSYYCRQCGNSINWQGSYYWSSAINEYGEVINNVQYLNDPSMEGDERINTKQYSDAGIITRGIFCSESCARTNLDNWTYPEEYKQEILSNK